MSKVSARPLLEVRQLSVEYQTGAEPVRAVTEVDFTLHRGEILGLAGESGSGKSTLAYAVARLLRPPALVTGGEVRYWPRGGRTLYAPTHASGSPSPRGERGPAGEDPI